MASGEDESVKREVESDDGDSSNIELRDKIPKAKECAVRGNGSGDCSDNQKEQSKSAKQEKHEIPASEQITLTFKNVEMKNSSPFEGVGRYDEPIIQVLMSAIEKHSIHPNKKKPYVPKIYVEQQHDGANEGGSHIWLVNPNVPVGWYQNYLLKYDFKKTEPASHVRNFNGVTLQTKHVSFIVDQRKVYQGDQALKIAYADQILVDGIEGETLIEMLQNDGRFDDDFLESCCIKTPDGKIKDKDKKIMSEVSKREVFILKLIRKMPRRKAKENSSSSATDQHNLHSKGRSRPSIPSPLKLNAIFGISADPEDNTALAATFSGSVRLNWSAALKASKDRNKQEKKDVKEISTFVQGFSNQIDTTTTVDSQEKLLLNAKSVCKIVYPDGQATGFILGCITREDKQYVLLMTNDHIVNGDAQRNLKGCKNKQTKVSFDYTKPPYEADSTYFEVLSDHVYVNDQALDFAVIGLLVSPELRPILQNLRFLGELVSPEYELKDKSMLQLVGHPEAKVKTMDNLILICDPKSELMAMAANKKDFNSDGDYVGDSTRIHYHCRSFEGSSGSPIFRGNQLIALHAAGIWLCRDDKRKGMFSNLEVGIPMHFIAGKIREKILAEDSDTDLKEDEFYELFPQFKEEKMDTSE